MVHKVTVLREINRGRIRRRNKGLRLVTDQVPLLSTMGIRKMVRRCTNTVISYTMALVCSRASLNVIDVTNLVKMGNDELVQATGKGLQQKVDCKKWIAIAVKAGRWKAGLK
ncbi:hypothetical protein DVH24_007988 [Malus domestica]|uniref:Uncharacterized protein n=1 Tax=Malus domestica TaxID=3750 RepID=A0A498JIC9_MALDO|nr:hypothetical protein DVH24_007988 [Malus domestica]